ncbi:MAG TPA: ATP-dependent RecD-like DNA helicase [Polyangiaceae bacterium]|nr:ATP-dependent RecD-like DNA helicase [Polyangiaceae bacterium]
MATQGRLPATNRPQGPSSVIEGVLDRVAFANEENAWSVVKIAVGDRAEPVTAVGNLLGVSPGENLRLTGRWVQDKRFGEQFQIESFLTVVPATLAGIERYLGSGMVRGIGKVMAERLVRKFGLATLDVIDREPQRLHEVEGIGRVRSEQIKSAWTAQRAIKDVMVFLQSHGVSTSHAVKIYKRYGERAIAVVRENPYRLATDIFGIGFQTADGIAKNLGVLPTSPERCRAGVIHALSTLAEEGHVAALRSDLALRTRSLLEVDLALGEAAVVPLAEAGDVVIERGGFDEDAVYLAPLHTAEKGIADLVLRLVRTPKRPLSIDTEKAIRWFEEQKGIELAPEQRKAIALAIEQKVIVITGGPGTGKTTLINGIIQILGKKGRQMLLAAPTGRAAKRMTETTGHEAKTLHRLLEWSPKSSSFARAPDNPLEADIVIVDEASMLDTVMAYSLLRALPATCQLVVVGDVDQLPSVGPGSVLSDIIRSQAVAVVRLAHIFRQAQESRIVMNAHRVNQGEMPLASFGDASSDFYFIEKSEPEEVLATIKTLVQERIPRKFGFHPTRDVQLLTPMHKGLLGAATLNTELQALMNPSGPSISRGSRLFRLDDKVMQIRNNYDLDVFNGDIGRVAEIDTAERAVTIAFDGRPVIYDEADLDELTLAYACSIHKSQGSEYPCVVLPLHTQHFVMLRRNLLYTAITRGRKLVVIVGNRRALSTAVRNADTVTRLTGLSWRLAKALGEGR